MAKPLIIDCDPGADDAVLLLMALAKPDMFNVLGITTISGNAPLELININTLKIVELSQRTDIKVYSGCHRPLVRKPIYATYVHGETGMDGLNVPDPTLSLETKHAVDFIIEAMLNSSEKVTLSVSGPMTNIALALIREPRIVNNIEEIVFMGGSNIGGNITPAAEFNFYVDPHAAHIVLSTDIPLRMFGLEVTHQLVTSDHSLKRLRALKNRVGSQVANILEHGVTNDIIRFGLTGRAVHDACITAYLSKPDLFTFKKARVLVDHVAESTIGATLVNDMPTHIQDQWVWVANTIQADAVFDLIIELMGTY